MTRSQGPLTFLGIAGSLRRGSYNRGLIRAAVEVAPEGTTVVPFDLSDLPMFNADVEAEGDPAAVAAFKRAISAADALLIATPEYNHCVPGLLKNAIDWASRPARRSVLTGKPVAIMGATPGSGGTGPCTGASARRARLHQRLRATPARGPRPTRGREVRCGGQPYRRRDSGSRTRPARLARRLDAATAFN
jgi:multimeric flavodoxin WrbA